MIMISYVPDQEGHHGRRICFLLHSPAGVHPKVVSERLGHSAVGITLDTYSHVLPGMQEDAVRLLDAALAMAMKKNNAEKA